MKKIIFILAIITVCLMFYFQSTQSNNAKKYYECNVNAGKLYDVSREKIQQNLSGYSNDEQKSYYDANKAQYAKDLESCKSLYANK